MRDGADWRGGDQRTSQLEAALRTCASDPGLLHRFLLDLLTDREITMLADRWAAAFALLEDVAPQREIADRLGLATATVNRVGQTISGRSSAGGFREVYARLSE